MTSVDRAVWPEGAPSFEEAIADAAPGGMDGHVEDVTAADAAPADRPVLEAIDGGGEGRLEDEPIGGDTFHLSDVGNAQRLLRLHGHDLRFVHGWGKWLVWDGRRWKTDETGEPVRRMVATLRNLVHTANMLLDPKEREVLVKHAVASERAARVTGALQLASSIDGVPVVHDVLDADPFLLNVANGTIDLRTGELRPHDRGDLITKLIPVEYDPDATSPLFNAFLKQVLVSDELVRYVVALLGYTLTGDTGEQVLPILHGAGANGKTTLLEVIRDLLGDYGQQAPAEMFLERRDTVPNDIARLPGARFVAATETGEGRRLNEVLVKRLTGGDTMTARFMRAEWFEFRPQFKAWLATNHRPVVRGADDAIWRRLRLIPFDVQIPAGERDKHLREKLRAELPGILTLAVQACLKWQKHGLPEAAAVTDATTNYRTDSDVIGRFIADDCVTLPDVKVKASDLYDNYVRWAQGEGEEPVSKRTLGLRLQDRGFTSHRTNQGRWWLGISLRSDA